MYRSFTSLAKFTLCILLFWCFCKLDYLLNFFSDSFLLQTAMDLYVLILYPITLMKMFKSSNNILVLYDLYVFVTQFCCAPNTHSRSLESPSSLPDSAQYLCLWIKSYCNTTYQSLSIIYSHFCTMSTLLST